MEGQAAESSAAAGRRSPQPGLIIQLWDACKSLCDMLIDRRSILRGILHPEWYTDLDNLFFGPIGTTYDAMRILQVAHVRCMEIPVEWEETARRNWNLKLQHRQAYVASLDRVIRLVEGRDPEGAKTIIRRELGVALAERCRFLRMIFLPLDVVADYLILQLMQHYQMTIGMLEEKKLALVGILYPGLPSEIARLVVDADLDAIFQGPLAVSEYAILELEQARLLGVAREWVEIGWMHLELLQRHQEADETHLDALVSLLQGQDPEFARIVLRAYAWGYDFQFRYITIVSLNIAHHSISSLEILDELKVKGDELSAISETDESLEHVPGRPEPLLLNAEKFVQEA